MRQYCLGQPPLEQPGYTSIWIYLGHMKPLAKILTQTNTWMNNKHMLILLTPIQEEKAQEICWLLYTTKASNCKDLARAIATAIGIPTAAHFKQIISGRKQGTKASVIHLMVADQHTKDAMHHLEQIYGENRMMESATKFPLRQCLLLAPLATELNEKTWKA